MAVGIKPLPKLLPVQGIRIGITEAGIRYKNRPDLVVFELNEGATTAAVFTKNAFCAAPVVVAKSHLATAQARFLLINAGNANAGTGERGLEDAMTTCAWLAEAGKCGTDQVLPFSTGVIGQHLPTERFKTAIPAVLQNLDADHWELAAKAIMTTDTVPKAVSRSVVIDGSKITINGICKGAGMIRPDMATMLAYVATDACVNKAVLEQCLRDAAAKSFNRITIDGDTSTNDACVLVATNRAQMRELNSPNDARFAAFSALVTDVCIELAQMVIRDGEGATKFITIAVEQGKTVKECEDVAYTIAHSPLVKTAFFASDPNWGRILAAVGRAGVQNMVLEDIQLFLDDVRIVSKGGVDEQYTEQQGQRVMKQSEITITVKLGRGTAGATVWTTDFSYDYVKINAEYRS